jgi:uncharacterized iron-regulated protein
MQLITMLLINLIFSSTDLFSATTVYNFHNSQYQSIREVSQFLSGQAHYLLGEFHYNDKVQNAQAHFISEMVKAHQADGAFDVHWEFLNYKSNDLIKKKFIKFKQDVLSVEQFLDSFNQSRAISYRSILNVTKKYNGQLYGVNASRKVKGQIIKDGLGSLNPEDIPPNMKLGSAHYFERFKQVMAGHVSEEELKAYYLAQCYTDAVMSYYMNNLSNNPLAFLIVGAFHSDYGLGTTKALRDLGKREIVNLKFVDKSLLSSADLSVLLNPSRKLGKVADYLILID